jgi:N-acetylneuraminic acid mutarotase
MFHSIRWRTRWLLSSLSAEIGTGRRVSKKARRRVRACLEELESRLAPASFFVNAQLQVSRLDNLGDVAAGTHAVVFFESAVANYQILRQGLQAGTDAVVLDSAGDGVKEMAAFLGGRHDLATIGVVAHGAPGVVNLGTAALRLESLTSYARELSVLGSALGRGGELDLWSCNVAAGEAGASLVRDLALTTGGGVAAADHLIGAAALGGNWQLEVRTSEARGAIPFSATSLNAFQEVLGAWSPAAPMAVPRSDHNATLLMHGKVLVTGGYNNLTSGILSAQLYDPATNTWSPSAGSMATPRNNFTATLLTNGKVLIAGGYYNKPISSAELYDPVSNTWSPAASMAAARGSHTATLLANGKVLVAGGDTNHGFLSSAELYDPQNNTWSSAGSMGVARAYQTATLLTNGKVLLAGGDNAVPVTAELYDPATNTWSAAGSLAVAQFGFTATLLGNGKVLIAGGGDLSDFTNSAQLYDPFSNSWSLVASMHTQRSGHTATLLGNGKVLIVGGVSPNRGAPQNTFNSSAELYDPANNTWSFTGAMSSGRWNHTATLLNNGRVLVTGGFSSGVSPYASAELYTLAGTADPSHSVIAVAPANIQAGGTATVTLTAKDATGNPEEGGGLKVSFGLGAGTASGTFGPATDNGDGTYSATFTATSAGPISVTGTLNGQDITSTAPTISVWPVAAATHLVFAGVTGTTAGVPVTFTMIAQDSHNAPVPGYTGTAHFTSSDPQAALPADYTFTAADAGVHIFTSTLKTTGSRTLTAADIESAISTQASIKVIPAVATHYVITGPATVARNATFSITVSAVDAYGNVDTAYFGVVHFSDSISGSTLPADYSFDIAGSHTFTGLRFTQDGLHTITVVDTGGTVTGSWTINVNTATKLVITNVSATSLTAGDALSLTVTAEDSTGAAVPSYTGTVRLSSSDGQATAGAGSMPSTYRFVTSDSGVHTFTVVLGTAGAQTITATDQATSSLKATTSPITVNAGPFSKFVVSVPSSDTVIAGTPFLVTTQAADAFGNPVTSYSGPITVTIAASPPDPQANGPATSTLGSSGFGFFLKTLKTAGAYTLTTTAGSFSGTSSSVAVTPADANHFAVVAPAATTTGNPIDVTVTALDPFGNIATGYSGQVHMTSSDPHGVLPADATLSGGVGTFRVSLTSAGSQTITATDTVSINPTITGTSSAIATRGLTVTSFTPTAAGFTVTFSKPIVASDISLYGGTQASPIQNVTLRGKNTASLFGPVNGTLIIEPSGISATFKPSSDWLQKIAGQTDGVLPNDTWTVTLQSGTGVGANANGFFDSLGAPFDGANDGGHANYVTTFSTANDSKPALTIPDFACGPDGSATIKVPNNSAKGIPVTLASAPAGTKDVVFTLTYNPTLLTVTNAGTGDSSAAGSTFTMGSVNNVDSTHSKVTFSWHNDTALSGDMVLGDILANVPNSAASQYRAKELLTLDAITINGNPFTGVTSPAVNVNAYFGDLSGDGQLTGLDLAIAANVAAGSPTSPIGLSAYKLVDPGLVGDIGGNGSIDAAAISGLAALLAHVPTPTVPLPPAGLTIAAGGPDPTLSLAAVGRIGNPSYFSVQVLIDNPRPEGSAGMTEAVLGLTYDPKVLTVSAADITLGSLPALENGWRLESVIDRVTGQIAIDLYSTTPITEALGGSLVNINFHMLPGAHAAAVVQLASSVTPLRQAFQTEVADESGQLVLSTGVDGLLIPAVGGSRCVRRRPTRCGQ